MMIFCTCASSEQTHNCIGYAFCIVDSRLGFNDFNVPLTRISQIIILCLDSVHFKALFVSRVIWRFVYLKIELSMLKLKVIISTGVSLFTTDLKDFKGSLGQLSFGVFD
jgi:hypothetical protein